MTNESKPYRPTSAVFAAEAASRMLAVRNLGPGAKARVADWLRAEANLSRDGRPVTGDDFDEWAEYIDN